MSPVGQTLHSQVPKEKNHAKASKSVPIFFLSNDYLCSLKAVRCIRAGYKGYNLHATPPVPSAIVLTFDVSSESNSAI